MIDQEAILEAESSDSTTQTDLEPSLDTLNRPPGPGYWAGMRQLQRMTTGNMQSFTDLYNKWGDTVCLRTPQGDSVVMIAHPQDVETVLKQKASAFPKGRRYHELIPVLGMGLVNSDGALWRGQRRVVQKQFSQQGTLDFLPIINRYSHRLLAEWGREGDSFQRDVADDMLRTTFSIAGDAFFGTGLEKHAESIRRNFKFALSIAQSRMFQPVKLPLSFPTPKHARFHSAIKSIDSIIYGIIDNYLEKDLLEENCVLARMIAALKKDGQELDRQQLRDEVCTILMVGHETSSVSLCWLLHFLSVHPRVQDRLAEEVLAHQWEGTPSPQDVQSLPYLAAVLNESLRVYPSVPFVLREAAHECELGGYRVKKGSTVVISPWVIHRHKTFWKKPENFEPERWLNRENEKFPAGAYIPFGLGPRTCLGEFMAQLEIKIIVADIVRNYRISPVEGFTPMPRGYISLQPETGMRLNFERRNIV